MSEEIKMPSYYAIIPANVRYDRDLRPNEKLLYGELTCLTNKNGYCYCSNNYFAELYDVTAQAVSIWINHLAERGYVRLEYIKNGKEVKERRIFIQEVSTKNEGVSNKIEEGIKKNHRGYQQKFKENNTRENNTRENNTRNNIINSSAEQEIASSEDSDDSTPPWELMRHEEKTSKKKKLPLTEREPENDLEKVEKAYLLNYKSLYERHLVKTESPIINWGQSRKMTKEAVVSYGLDNILLAIERSKDNEFCVQKGYSLTTILSTGVLSGLINGNNWQNNKNSYEYRKEHDAMFKTDHPWKDEDEMLKGCLFLPNSKNGL